MRGIEIVGDDDIDGGHRRDVRDAHDVFERRAGNCGAATNDGDLFVIESCWPTPTTTTVGSGPVAGLPSPSVSRFGSSALLHHGLVADHRSRRRAGVDAQIELESTAVRRLGAESCRR